MAIHCMCDKSYKEIQNKAYEEIRNLALASTKRAGEESKKFALERGNVTKSGVPFTKVCVDGTWAKRTYGTNYNSLSGSAVIIDWYRERFYTLE